MGEFGASRRRTVSRRGRWLAAAALVLALAGVGGAARAADTLDDMDAEDLLARAPEIEEARAWYLRGDIGYVFNETPDISGFIPASGLDGAGVFGLGFGVRLNDLLRVDLTADYRSPADATGFGATDFSAVTVLANAYLDLGTWNAVTPYVGAGVGAGHVSLSAPGFAGDADGWGLAWAVMAGAAVTLAPNWQLDLGYRFVSIENADIGGGFADVGQAAHEVRLGLRYLFD